MIMIEQLKQDAKDAENAEDYELAHSLYSILANRYRRLGFSTLADTANNKANVYATTEENRACGCIDND